MGSDNASVLYRTKKERLIYGNHFGDIFDFSRESNFPQKFYNLLNNLDLNSKDIIISCLYRIKALNTCEDDTIDIFTEEEKEKMAFVKKDLKCNIMHLAENVWAYRGYLLPINDFRAEIFFEKLGISCIEDRNRCAHKDMIDVGAYIGDSALILSELTSENVYAFEPVEDNIEYMKQTALMNQRKILPMHMAVSNINGKDYLSVGEAVFNSTIEEIGERKYVEKVPVTTVTIDQFVSRRNLTIGLIKIHAEGAEQKVLEGARNTISEQAPVIIVEMNHTEDDFYNIKPMIEEMRADYGFKVFKPMNGLICLGLKLIAEVKRDLS